jgi:RimJ/RimL family protein N-acetyltransferase
MNTLDELRTPRICLRRITANDLDDLARMYRDPVVMATLAGVRTEEETAGMLKKHLAHWETHGFGWWVMREPQTGEFMGRGGLRNWTIDGQPEMEIGYGLMSKFWGQGLATELARECVRVAFTGLRRADLVSFTLPTNLASRRVMEKAGLRYERDIVHADLPHVLYRIRVEEWETNQRAP